MDLKFTEPYLGSITVFTLDPTLAVELEAIGALVEPMEFWWRWVASHRNTSSLLPAAILGALSLESPSSGRDERRDISKTRWLDPCPANTPTFLWRQLASHFPLHS